MNLKFNLIIGFFFLLGGFVMDSGHIIDLFKHRQGPGSSQVYAQASSASTVNKIKISGFPNHIDIPGISISLPVKAGYYNNASQTWTLDSDSAYFATTTFEPNTRQGNTFIYGHDIPKVFRRLNSIKPGQTVKITTTNNHVFTYKYIGQHDTIPNDVSLFTYTGKPVLTLQTCSGFFSQDRRLFVFSLEGAA